MTKYLTYLIVTLAMFALLIFGAGGCYQAKAEREYARAAVIAAQGQSRLDTLAGIVPILAIVLMAVIVFGLLMLALRYAERQPQTITRIERIETRTIFVIPANVSRREVWRQLESEVKMIERLNR
jgi:uncharacterized membrane protein YciS (DUF1049 family)